MVEMLASLAKLVKISSYENPIDNNKLKCSKHELLSNEGEK